MMYKNCEILKDYMAQYYEINQKLKKTSVLYYSID